jgi:hypothetical protein
MRVYLNSDNDRIGVTQPAASGVTPAAVVVNLEALLNLSADAVDQFSFKNKGNFIIAMAPQLSNPSVEQLSNALNTISVNVVPLDIFSNDVKDIVSLVGEYGGMTFRPKPSSKAKTKPATR